MALESFLLHFRNLRAFLCPSLQMVHRQDIVAGDFLLATEAKDIGEPLKLDIDTARLDEMLSHLSYLRAGHIAAGDHGWKVAEMTLVLLEEIKIFLGSIPNQRQAQFYPMALIDEAVSGAKWKLQP
jgi:hypothetical protein